MVSTEDVQGYGVKFKNQLSKVHDAPIDDRDKEAILEFIYAIDAEGSVNRGTMVSNLNRLRLTAERSDVPLVDMSKTHIDSFIFSLKHDRGLSHGTIRNYRKALRKFYQMRGVEWADDIKIGASKTTGVDPSELLTEAEIEQLLDTCESARDKALIALLADTGLRIGAIASLRVRDVQMDGQAAMVTINENANVKGASGTIPLTWSEGFIAGYLNVHPNRSDIDAALLHRHAGYESDDEDDNGALRYQYLARRVKRIADKAGIDRARVNTHNFRKSAISRWIREGLSEQAIKHRACWDVDTDQIKTYSGVRDEELNDQILEHYGIETASEESTRPDLESCPRCSAAIRSSDRFCPGCAAPLTASAAESIDQVEDAIFDGVTSNMTSAAEIGAFRERFNSNPQFRERFVSSLMESGSIDTHTD